MVEVIKKMTKIGWRKIGYGVFTGLLIWSFMMWGRPTGFMSGAPPQLILDPMVAKHCTTALIALAAIVVGGNIIEMLSPGINAWLGARGKDS